MSAEVKLIVEDTPIVCQRKILINNSDYFRAMLEGHFIESSKADIRLEGVNSRPFNLILEYLWDNSMIFKNEDILSVLETSCMLQFVSIRDMCIEKLIEILSPKNCINIWIATEKLDIVPLYLKAKCMALDEFDVIKELDCLNELSLDVLCLYLGHTCLSVKNEFDVFQVIMRWWYENQQTFSSNDYKIFLKLLSCVDFHNLEPSLIKEMLTYPDLASNIDICSVLNYIISVNKSTKNDLNEDLNNTSDAHKTIASKLLDSKKRQRNELPCIFFQRAEDKEELKPVSLKNNKSDVCICDKFKRKRVYAILGGKISLSDIIVAHYDCIEGCFKSFFGIDENKCKGLDGFKVLGYKEFVFLFGGEYLLGKGNWNYNFWIYDTFRERWERKTRLPYPRRHFETCLVNSTVYFVGGTGNYRIIQENVFGYNFKEDVWSKQISLPCSSRQIKCCDYLNQLFILSLSDCSGYIFNETMNTWHKIKINDIYNQLKDVAASAMFSFNDRIFIKGNALIEIERIDSTNMAVVSKNADFNISYEKIECVRCHTDLFTLYQIRTDGKLEAYTLEKYNLKTKILEYIFENQPMCIEVDNTYYMLSPLFKMFSFHHHSLVRENVLINENFIS